MRIANKLGMQQHESLYLTSGYAIAHSKAEKVLQLLERLFVRSYPWLRGGYGIRAVKADDLWLSMGYGADMCHIGFYMSSCYGTAAYLAKAENIVLSLGGLPHWGKPFDPIKVDFASVYPKWQEFKALRQTMDPNGVFENEWARNTFAH